METTKADFQEVSKKIRVEFNLEKAEKSLLADYKANVISVIDDVDSVEKICSLTEEYKNRKAKIDKLKIKIKKAEKPLWKNETFDADLANWQSFFQQFPC